MYISMDLTKGPNVSKTSGYNKRYDERCTYFSAFLAAAVYTVWLTRYANEICHSVFELLLTNEAATVYMTVTSQVRGRRFVVVSWNERQSV